MSFRDSTSLEVRIMDPKRYVQVSSTLFFFRSKLNYLNTGLTFFNLNSVWSLSSILNFLQFLSTLQRHPHLTVYF